MRLVPWCSWGEWEQVASWLLSRNNEHVCRGLDRVRHLLHPSELLWLRCCPSHLPFQTLSPAEPLCLLYRFNAVGHRSDATLLLTGQRPCRWQPGDAEVVSPWALIQLPRSWM